MAKTLSGSQMLGPAPRSAPRPVPDDGKPKLTAVTVRLPDDVVQILKRVAYETDMTRQEIVAEALAIAADLIIKRHKDERRR